MGVHAAHAVIIGPDFYVFGAVDPPAGIPALVEDLLLSIEKTKESLINVR